jgi:hypothetical protein
LSWFGGQLWLRGLIPRPALVVAREQRGKEKIAMNRIFVAISLHRFMVLLGVAGVNTSVGVFAETFLLLLQ